MEDTKEFTDNLGLVIGALGDRGIDGIASEIKKTLASEDKFREATNSTDPEILIALSKEANDIVRARVAENSATPPEVQEELAKDSVKEVKLGIAKNVNATSTALSIASRTGDDDVKLEVAKHFNTSAATFLTLTSASDTIKSELLDNEKCPADALDILAGDSNVFILLKVAIHKSTPERAVVKMVQSHIKDEYVLIELAVRANIPPESLTILATSDYASVRKAVMNNDNTPPDVRRGLRSEFF